MRSCLLLAARGGKVSGAIGSLRHNARDIDAGAVGPLAADPVGTSAPTADDYCNVLHDSWFELNRIVDTANRAAN
jgi:hypothetical protein